MICPSCQIKHANLYCSSCLSEGVATHQHLSRGLQRQVDESVNRATLLNGKGTGWRELRASVRASETRLARLKEEVRLREDTIALACNESRTVPSSSTRRVSLERIRRDQQRVTYQIVQARRVLVQEAMAVFGVELEDDTIAGISLPPPHVLKDHSPTLTNAALVHTLHLVSLLTRYLSVTLPFIPLFPDMPHIGRPLVRPNLPFVNTTKFREKHVLWMSSAAKREDSKGIAKYRQFLTSFALLSHSISYLAWTQGVEGIGVHGGKAESSSEEEGVPDSTVLIPATSILRLLSALADSPSLGNRSHEPPGELRHLGFGLDVTRVIDAVLATEGDDYDWDMVEHA